MISSVQFDLVCEVTEVNRVQFMEFRSSFSKQRISVRAETSMFESVSLERSFELGQLS